VSSAEAARSELAERNVNLAILDIRLVDDEDEKDISGLALAKAVAYRNIPKIILTGFPTYDAVRDMLKQEADGSPPALDFLEKKEGHEAMLIAVEAALKASRKQWESRLDFGLFLLLGALLAGGVAIILDDPRWLIVTVILATLFGLSMRRVAVS
jgi:DNA-binding NtrC family response regulator